MLSVQFYYHYIQHETHSCPSANGQHDKKVTVGKNYTKKRLTQKAITRKNIATVVHIFEIVR